MTTAELYNNISELKSYTGRKLSKYYRNYRRYNFTRYATIEDIKTPSVIGWVNGEDFYGEDDTTPTPEMNVIKSCIDTLTSKIAQSKVRPFFNCINGSFKDIQTVKQAQQFFDVFFDEKNVNKTVSEAFRDCCVFDTGVIFVDDELKNIRRALPYHVHFRPAEMNYGKLTRVYYEQKHFPVSLLPETITEKIKNYKAEFVTYGLYYDTFNHVKAVYIPDCSYVEMKPFESTEVPFIFLHFNSPILGDTSESIVDMLNGLQLEIDVLMAKIKDASQLSPALTFFVPEGSTLKAAMLSNKTGNVYTYKPTPNMTSNPVESATPPFIDPQYLQTIEQLKQSAYEMVGISQLSAQSSKPTGLNSGIALQTMENIESDRFETQLNQVIRAYVQLAKTCIAVFDKNENILPESKNRVAIKWGDIVEEAHNMSIQFSGADALSKDPSTKLQQLTLLAQAGVMPQSRIAQFMEIPDLQSGYSLSNNAINAVMTVIDDCIKNDNFNVPEYVPYQMLKEEIINTQLSLKAANGEKNADDIEKLTRLYDIVEQQEEKWQSEIEEINGATQELAQETEGALPAGQNVLTQEANMQQIPANAQPQNYDMAADGQMPGNWNAQ